MIQGIGNKIRMCRRDKNFTQKDLAKMLQTSVAAVGNWEIEKHYPDRTNVTKLSKIFNKPMSFFYDEMQDDKIARIELQVNELRKDNQELKERYDKLIGMLEKTAYCKKRKKK